MSDMHKYIIYYQDGTVEEGHRANPFNLSELQGIVDGRITLLEAIVDDIQGFIIVCEDGLYKFPPNVSSPEFYGNILFIDKKLME